MPDLTNPNVQQSFFVFVEDSNTGKIKRIALPADVQIGLNDSPSELHLTGRLSLAVKRYETGNYPRGVIDVGDHNTVASIYTNSLTEFASITVRSPSAPRDGQIHCVKDSSGTAADVPIDVVSASGKLIDGVDTKTITIAYGAMFLFWQTDQWYVISSTTAAGGGSYTDEEAQDAVGTILTNTTTINFTYSDGTPSISAIVNNASLGVVKLANGTAGSLITWSAGGVATIITPGTIGDILTSNGPGFPSTYQPVSIIGVPNWNMTSSFGPDFVSFGDFLVCAGDGDPETPANSFNITLPEITAPDAGKKIMIKTWLNASVTILPFAGQQIVGQEPLEDYLLSMYGSCVELVAFLDTPNSWLVSSQGN